MKAPTAADIAYQVAHIDDNGIPGIIAANVICIVAAWIAVPLRLYSRRLVRAPIKTDDWFVIASLLTATLYVISYCLTTHYNLGRHTILVTDIYGFAVTAIIAEVIYNPPITCVKLSVLFLYRRLFPSNNLKKALGIIGAFVLSYNTAAVFVVIFQCYPIEANWDPTVSGQCVNYGDFVLVNGVLNILSDFIILCLPLPILWRLQVSTNQKWVLSGMFLLGGFVCIISIVRLFFLQKVASTADPAWDDINGATLSTIEICVAIVSACLPTYRPLYKLVRYGKVKSATARRGKSTGYHDLQYESPIKSGHNTGIGMNRSATCWAAPTTLNSGSDDREELHPGLEPPARSYGRKDSQSIAVKTQIDVLTNDRRPRHA